MMSLRLACTEEATKVYLRGTLVTFQTTLTNLPPDGGLRLDLSRYQNRLPKVVALILHVLLPLLECSCPH